MIPIEDIYAATDGGKRILLDYVHVARERGMFSYRGEDDKDPSAHLFQTSSGMWGIKDFGDRFYTPIAIFMRANGMDEQRDFYLAIQMLADKYGITDTLDKSVNRPRIVTRPATADEHDGDHPFKTKESISESEAKLWGRNVKPEHLKEFGWSSVERIASVKDGKVTERYSTDTYSIFIQSNSYIDVSGNERVFYKVYQPYSFDKKWRFYYIGKVQPNYVFGMNALRARYHKQNKERFEQIAIVSGGSDAVNALGMGLPCVYLGSETAELTPDIYSELTQMGMNIYLIYDCDETGIRMAKQIALKYMDIKVVWLPKDELDSYHDKRGNALKDLKDYCQIHPSKYYFDMLLRQARPARFWSIWKEKDKNSDSDKWKSDLSLTRLCYFLWLNNYVVLRDPLYDEARFVHIDGIIVEEVTLTDIHHFIKEWMMKHGLPDFVIDKVMRSRDVTAHLANNMTEVELDFTSTTATSQWFYFQNCCVEVTKDGITPHRYVDMSTSGKHAWKHQIIPHNYVEHEKMFSIEHREDGGYSIVVHSLASETFCFLINISRNFWRKEKEYRFGDDQEAKAEYARTHKFCIDGEGLNEEEIHEQMQSLVNKIFVYGYLLHRHKIMSRAWGVFCYDGHIGENDECNGRTGKSLFCKIVREYLSTVTIEAKNPHITERQFLYAKVNYDTDFLFIDECHKNLDYDHFYSRITDDFQVEKKGVDPESIPFEKSPKLAICSNYINKKNDASTKARELPCVFSDYYHQMAKNNDYLENLSVADEFGHNLINNNYEGWEADIAFLMQCEQAYFTLVEGDNKVMPPLGNIERRQQKALMGKSFEDWANDYYQVGGGHLDVAEKLDNIHSEYRKAAQSQSVDTEPFVRKLQEYCDYAEHIAVFNPKDITGKDKDGERRWRKHETSGQVRYIYIRSTAEAKRMDEEANPKPKAVQSQLDFSQIDEDTTPYNENDIAPF